MSRVATAVNTPRVSQTLHSARVAISNDDEQTVNPTVGDGLSKLNYVDIKIHGIQGTETALHDNGSEINLINREFVEQLSNLPSIHESDQNQRCCWTGS